MGVTCRNAGKGLLTCAIEQEDLTEHQELLRELAMLAHKASGR